MGALPRYTLQEGEAAVVTALARWRYHANRKAGVVDGKIGPQAGEQSERNGLGGEFAFARMQNVFPDMTIGPRKGGADCLSSKGKWIDVKTTEYRSGKLPATKDKEKGYADFYVLLVGKFPGPYTWVGWATEEELLREENLTDLGHGPTYALEQSALHRPCLPDYLPEGWLS